MSKKTRPSTQARLRESIAEVQRLAVADNEPHTTPSVIRVRTQLTFDASGHGEGHRSVFCRRRGSSVDVHECTQCPRAMTAPEHAPRANDIVVCATEKLTPHKHDAAELAMRTLVGEIAARPFVCIPPETSWEVMEDLLVTSTHNTLIVVDASQRPCGVVSAGDLLLCPESQQSRVPAELVEPGFHIEAQATTARDIMSPIVHTLYETTPLSFAISVLGDDSARTVPVLSPSGTVVGIISATDVARWMAAAFGYECC